VSISRPRNDATGSIVPWKSEETTVVDPDLVRVWASCIPDTIAE
jgi:hypothetical protein